MLSQACEAKYKQYQSERQQAATNLQKTYRGHNQRARLGPKDSGGQPPLGPSADVLAAAATAVQARFARLQPQLPYLCTP